MSNDKLVKIESVSKACEFLGLEKPTHPLVTVMPIDNRMTEFDYGDSTYVFGFYQVSLKAGIDGSIIYGRNTYDFQEGTMVFSKPGQAMSFSQNESSGGEYGWTLLFHPDLIRKSSLGEAIERYSFFSYEVNEALHLSDVERKTITDIVERIQDESEQRIDQHSQTLIVSSIELLLNYCSRFYDRQFMVRTNLNQDLISKFESVLMKFYDSQYNLENGLPTVKYCAERMNMSANYLSDLLKKETGNSAQQHIQEYVIDKAKTRLLNSSDQISQIAYDLGFEYPQHFSKLFKSKTGMSPADYRKAHSFFG